MWSNIGNVEEHKASMEFLPSPKNDTESGTGRFLFADCQAANTLLTQLTSLVPNTISMKNGIVCL